MKTPTRALTVSDALLLRATIPRVLSADLAQIIPQRLSALVSPAAIPRLSLGDLILILAFSWVTALCARISFSIGVVPITGQTFAVLLAGAALGSRKGALSQLTYLAQGAAGLPVFTWLPTMGYGGGLARFAGPTGGYLVGFVFAAYVVGYLAEHAWDRRFATTALAMLIGNIVIYAFGVPWLASFDLGAYLTGWQVSLATFDPTGWVLAMGLYPFIIGDLIKLVLAATALPSVWALLSRSRG